ncbi:MAG: hypothetical protein ABW122_05085 [Ilumatobacteraceae bacterium]
MGDRTVRHFALAAVSVVVLGQCAPQCAPIPASPAPLTGVAPAPPTTLTMTFDGAGPSAPRIGLIGDSTLASIRWSGTDAPLRQWNYTFDAESCRRTITASCHGPDGYAPANVVDVMNRLRGQLGTVLVMMVGANDPVARFGEGVDVVLGEARAQGIATVIWLTVHGADDRNGILAQRSQESGGFLVVADWAAFSAPHPEWTNADGLHINSAGAAVLSQFIADHVGGVLAGGPAGA